ncbi:MAG TPA: ABC transporter ATP-binding protein [Solirubrobacteraceae bacterium]|nr:ABC transporter ATP-binding protein [Solirubrobacteraceae bacterium]
MADGARQRDAAITVESLRVDRGGREILHEVSLAVATGTVTGLLGPSGCGKTTLMRAIVGVQIVAGGAVTVLGRPAGAVELRRRVGYVTQAPSVYADLTVFENLRYFAAIAEVGGRRLGGGRVAETIETVGLNGYEHRLVGSLSGGECSRVSLATALLGEPELLVLDEPTVGLDPVLRAELWASFHELAGLGTTLLVSSHVMDEASECDSLLLMRDGALLEQVTPDGLRRQTGEQDLSRAFLAVIERAEAETGHRAKAEADPGNHPEAVPEVEPKDAPGSGAGR